jgi:hypothetical protein
METVKNFINNNPWAKNVMFLVIGVAIGAIFYPTKRIEEKVKSHYEQLMTQQAETYKTTIASYQEKLDKVTQEKQQLEIETHRKITSLTIQIRDLKSKTKESYYKIVRPDGTIEIKKFKESEINESTQVISSIREEFDTKIKQINEKYEKIHRERVEAIRDEFLSRESSYKKTIADLEKSKVTEVNKKTFGVDAGILSNKNYYGHLSADLFGPVYVALPMLYNPDINSQSDKLVGGLGIGIRF